ncbi:MAG: hypothetical protein JRG91_15655 [Deltaproteobacteria bacterium]|nr:hypothetical protein [Deltaproteobacteria bacterium]
MTITRTAVLAMLAWLCLPACANTGVSGEPDATDVPAETDPVCGNAIVEEGEECDGSDEPCRGPECPGWRTCLDDCTLGECVSGTFQILSGPSHVNEDVGFEQVTRIDLAWAGSRYGVFYSGRRVDPMPLTQTAYFTPVSLEAEVAGPTRQILPDLYVIEEIQAEWNPSARNYGVLLVTASPDDNLIANLADAAGDVLIDIGVLITSESEASHARAVLGQNGYGFTWQMGPRAAAFARLSEDLVILDLMSVDSDEPSESFRRPLLATQADDYHVLSHVDDPSSSHFELTALRFTAGGYSTTLHSPFADTSPGHGHPADMVLTDTHDMVVFGVDTAPGDPVLPVLLGRYDHERETAETMTLDGVGLTASAPYDVSITLNGDTLAIALASADLDDPSAYRQLVIHRTLLDGTPIGSSVLVPVDRDASMPSIAWDGEAYAIAYAVDRGGGEADVDVELVRLGCQMP